MMEDIEADLVGIANLMRRHIEIRNRSWLKRIHRDCFVGSEAVDFLVTQGFADTRKAAVETGVRMANKKLIRNITDSSKFSDSLHYYRFRDDDVVGSVLDQSLAGNGAGIRLGHGGCRWSFAPHTAHNSYILDIGLAEEIERVVAGASIESRMAAINKLRSRVREQAEADAPNWELFQTTKVNNTQISIFQRKRPRGEWKNVKMTGVVAESPVGFIRSIAQFEKRKQWESTFEDGVIVEGIETGEKPSSILLDADEASDASNNNNTAAPPTPPSNTHPETTTPTATPTTTASETTEAVALPESILKQSNPNIARPTDDVYTFLQTVDLAGIPHNMAIAFLNDPERQHALAYLRKQMMLSNPQECMLCQTWFESSMEIRFCPCCAMVSCAGCVSKRVFEVVSRNVMSVCVHCFRESSRIFQPPQAVQDTNTIGEELRGKWWRPEELGILDYSKNSTYTASSPSTGTTTNSATSQSSSQSSSIAMRSGLNHRDSLGAVPSLYNDQDDLDLTNPQNLNPLIPGLLDGLVDPATGKIVQQVQQPQQQQQQQTPKSAVKPQEKQQEKTARCKNCGQLISRDMEAIEAHQEECLQIHSPVGRKNSLLGGNSGKRGSMTMQLDAEDNEDNEDDKDRETNDSNNLNAVNANANTANGGAGNHNSSRLNAAMMYGNHKQFAGIPRKPDLGKKHATRIIYRTASTASSASSPACEICALQDSFVDADGSAYLYEISVRHSEVRGLPDYTTADVMLLLYVARPIRNTTNNNNNPSACTISIIHQIDTRSRGQGTAGSYWSFLSFGSDYTARDIAGLRKEDLVRELKACGNLTNLLNGEATASAAAASVSANEEKNTVCLDDFELLAVLGRGGFGKVMQVRHKTSNEVYAMKILKKSELRRRRQVERTQTERTILANVRHPFIVCLHYAFQSTQKLYMVMDFVQGGDFFTLMRKFRRLPEDWVRLYGLQVAMALDHLHDREIVYRDLKPENILLCADGYLKLTDFGLSRYFETRPPNPEDIIDQEKDDFVTRSFCGTEQYMSPEMLLQQGHNYRMDWWCLGLLMHEMITGRHPFYGASHYDTLRNMVTKPPTIDPRISISAVAVIKGLLIKNPRTRLGGKEGLAEFKNLQFFSVVNWDDLYHKRIEMPYKPKLQGETDISSFETTFTREKPIDSVPEPDPQENEKRKSAKGGILGMFGYGKEKDTATAGNNAAANTAGDNANPGGNKQQQKNGTAGASDGDVFKGFAFNKEEDVGATTTSEN